MGIRGRAGGAKHVVALDYSLSTIRHRTVPGELVSFHGVFYFDEFNPAARIGGHYVGRTVAIA